jgi:alkylhydroperoxidase family enzyme
MQTKPMPFTMLSDEEARKRLPAVGTGGRLPVWARILAGELPETTAALLRLDYLHRARSPLDPLLCGKLRLVTARANRCAYGEAYAAADLRRAGLGDAGFRELEGEGAGVAPPEREALAFARKLTLAVSTITDEEVAGLIRYYGESRVVAMVLFLLYANLLDRLALALGLPPEAGGSAPPTDVHPAGRALPPKIPWPRLDNSAPLPDLAEVSRRLDREWSIRPRIRVPLPEEVPPGPWAKYPPRLQGLLVPLGYQPELAFPWMICANALKADAHLDPLFGLAIWWVVASTVRCFY